MNGISGNNALKRDVSVARGDKPASVCRVGYCGPRSRELPTAALKCAVTGKKPSGIPYGKERKRELAEAEKLVRRKYGKKRSRYFLMYFASISFCALVFTGILFRQAQIMEMNYQNVRLEREINRIRTDTESIREEFAGTADMSLIRKIAAEELGMRKPASSQIITVVIPKGDRVILSSQDTGADIADLDSMFENVEGFFKTMR